jgi:hypothetical protein
MRPSKPIYSGATLSGTNLEYQSMDIKHWKDNWGDYRRYTKQENVLVILFSLFFFFRQNRSTFCPSLLGVAASEKGLGLGAGGAAASEEAEESLADPEDGDDGECQSGPVDEGGRPLVWRTGGVRMIRTRVKRDVRSNTAKRHQAIAMLPARSPSADENA